MRLYFSLKEVSKFLTLFPLKQEALRVRGPYVPGWQWKLEPCQAVLPFLVLFCHCGLLVFFFFIHFLWKV